MTEVGQIGNVKWVNREACRGDELSIPPKHHRNRLHMTISARIVVFRRSRTILTIAALAIAAALPGAADAKMVRGGGYDGVWNVTFATTRGTCSSGYSVPFTVAGSRVTSAGGGRVSGSINRTGGVVVQISVGASHAAGGGRLAGTSGSGSWRGIISGDNCSGTWQASRT
jgi:hypothetical protein